MNQILAGLFSAWAFCGCLQSTHAAQTKAPKSRPNVVVILTDDQGYGDVGCHGNDTIKTPNLDRLAAESVEFTQFYCCPNCSPTRASLLTGRYNYRTGVTEVSRGRHFMHADEVTLAEILRSAGYRTGIFGKWHLGDTYPMRPTDQGFDEALVHKGGGIGQAAGPPGNTYFDPILEHNNQSKRYAGYCNDIFTDAAIEFIETHGDRPFFVYLASNLPHFPLQIGEDYVEPYRKLGLHELNAKTYGMITNIDDNVGRLLAALRRLQLEDNTIVVFLSDNGPRTRRTKNDLYPDRYNAGLRGTKTSVYENGIRVPFFFRWPSRLTAGRKVSEVAAHIDLLPTLLEACRIPLPEGIEIDGVSLLPLLKNETNALAKRNLFFQWHNGDVPFRYVHFAVRSDRYKLIQPQDNPHGITHYPDNRELERMLASLELYDIRRDPSEIDNLAPRHPAIVNEMLQAYEDWFRDVTSERPFVVPQRIHLGTAFESPTTLSQFDWRGVRSETGLGHWEVDVRKDGEYEVTLRFDPVKTPGDAHVRFAGVHVSQSFEKGETSCRFPAVRLDSGEGRFEAYLKFGRNSTGVNFVEVERLDVTSNESR